MSQQDLVDDLKASMPGMDDIFNSAGDTDFIRFLDQAALDFGRLKPLRKVGSIDLVADQSDYAAPSDLLRVGAVLYGVTQKARAKPWDWDWPGAIPQLSVVVNGSTRQLWLSPAPCQAQINLLGSVFQYRYSAAHVVNAQSVNTTIQPGDRGLLLLRAQAECMKDLAVRNVRKPVSMRDGMNSAPKNGTPAALYEQLMKQFEQQAIAA